MKNTIFNRDIAFNFLTVFFFLSLLTAIILAGLNYQINHIEKDIKNITQRTIKDIVVLSNIRHTSTIIFSSTNEIILIRLMEHFKSLSKSDMEEGILSDSTNTLSSKNQEEEIP